jgi:hypothetical protein
MFVGLAGPIFLLKPEFARFGIWALGLAFGLSISAHFICVSVLTLPFGGLKRFREFWQFYELRWGIAMAGIRVVYIPLVVLGLICALRMWA